MVEAVTVPVLQSRLESLEKEHRFLEAIRELNGRVDAARGEYEYAKSVSLEKKKAYDSLSMELQDLISGGPPKSDPQGRLPFAEGGGEAAGPAEGSPKYEGDEEDNLPIPEAFESLDLTGRLKQVLANTGAKTLADLSALGNGNWPQYPGGFVDLDGFGPKAAVKLAGQLPSTAVAVEEVRGHAPAKVVRVQLMTFSGASPNLELGDEYDATLLDDGCAIVQLPGEDAVQFSPHEYRVVS